MEYVAWASLVTKIVLIVVCSVGGYLIAGQIEHLTPYGWAPWAGVAVGFFFALLAIWLVKTVRRLPIKVLLGGTLGLVMGLLIVKLLSFAFIGIENTTIRVASSVVLVCIFGYVGVVLGSIKIEELGWPSWPFFHRAGGRGASLKILDTSVIIDGRIVDILQAGFLEGVLVIPEFVLQELQHIADSSDPSRKLRGRRGLDMLKKLQEEKLAEIRIERQDFPHLSDVDAKLTALAVRLNASIVTNDYNLSKVAEVQGIPVLNINRLANALRPVVLPGEVLRLQILKEGKEEGQGIAYLEDGTMVVVENAAKLLGQEVEASVTSILQTTGGRMIFTTLKPSESGRRH
uniref:TRAM domain-containing protein n=1 Tax=Desulfacinum infernum TaxID=35837 RepID=A0A832A250_9BACT